MKLNNVSTKIFHYCPKLLQTISFGLVFFFHIHSWSAPALKCQKLFEPNTKIIQLNKNLLNTKRILKKLKTSGIDADQVRIVLSYGYMATVNLTYKGRNIGHGELVDISNQDSPGKIYIQLISLQNGFEGKGLGILMYLALAKAAYTNGQILGSSYDLTTESAGLWKSLVKSGLAAKTESRGSSEYEFKFDVLQSMSFQAEVDRLLNYFKLRPGEQLQSTGHIKPMAQYEFPDVDAESSD